MKTCLGLDLGGTNAKCGLVGENGKIIERSRFEVKSERGPDKIIDDIIRHLEKLAEKSDKPPVGLAVGAAGLINQDQGMLITSPNLPGWKSLPLGKKLEEALGMDVLIENDANLYTLGEWHAGAGQGIDNLIGITLGTGVGAGILINGKILNGKRCTAGEAGHMVVEPEGYPCTCGSRGCLETIASGTAISRYVRQRIEAGRSSAYRGKPAELTADDLFQLAEQGDHLSLEAFSRAGRALGIALTGIFNLLGLEGIVIGGGVSGAFKFIYPSLVHEFAERAFVADPGAVVIRQASLGDDAALVGAAALFGT